MLIAGKVKLERERTVTDVTAVTGIDFTLKGATRPARVAEAGITGWLKGTITLC